MSLSFGRMTKPTKKPMKNDKAISVIAVVCVVRVGQHAGNQAVNCGEPLDNFEPVVLVDGEAHLLIACKNPAAIANNASPTMMHQNKVK